MDWSIALEKQATMRRVLKEIETSQKRHERLSLYFADSRPEVLQHLTEASEFMVNGPTYFVERDIAETIHDQAAGVPDDWSLTHDMLLSDHGFVWSDVPFDSVTLADTEIGERDWPIAGFAWSRKPQISDADGIALLVLTEDIRGIPVPLSWIGWPWGHTLERRLQYMRDHRSDNPDGALRDPDGNLNLPPATVRDNWEKEIQSFTMLIEFMHQKIVRRMAMRPGRATRRRLGLAPEHVPLITVITLRREQSPHDRQEPEDGARYQHRFPVRAHWRRQWYPSEGVHRPRMIAAYVKGPEGAPFVAKHHVFDVKR